MFLILVLHNNSVSLAIHNSSGCVLVLLSLVFKIWDFFEDIVSFYEYLPQSKLILDLECKSVNSCNSHEQIK